MNELTAPVRDGAIRIVCGDPSVDRQKRLQLVELVTNHQIRVSALTVLLHEWFSEEPANAEAWLPQSNLSNEDKADLLVSAKDGNQR